MPSITFDEKRKFVKVLNTMLNQHRRGMTGCEYISESKLRQVKVISFNYGDKKIYMVVENPNYRFNITPNEKFFETYDEALAYAKTL